MPEHNGRLPEEEPTRLLPKIDLDAVPREFPEPVEPQPAEPQPAEPEPAQPKPAELEPAEQTATRPTPQEAWQAFIRPGRGQLVAALVLFLTGLIVTLTLQQQANQPEFSNVRQADLVQLLDNVTAETRRLEAEIRDLERTRSELQTAGDQQAAAEEEAKRRIDQASILAGTVPATGPGIRMDISDPQSKVTAEILLDSVEELRDAGAEVIELNNSVRLVANSWFGSVDGQVVVDGHRLHAPYVIEAIGDPATLEAGARFRGGLVSEIEGERVGGQVRIEQLDAVNIATVVEPISYNFATPR